MKKIIYLTLTLLLVSKLGIAQMPYHDAVFLSSYGKYSNVTKIVNIKITKENYSKVVPVLHEYVDMEAQNEITTYINILEVKKEKLIKIDSTKNKQAYDATKKELEDISSDIINELQTALEGNDFISVSGSLQSSALIGEAISLVSKELPSKVGALNVTNIADGVAKFLVARTKEELSIAFFNKFQEKLKDQRKLQLLFPATHKNLQVIGDEIYMFSGYLEILREGFQKDLANLLVNFRMLINDKSMNEVFNEFPTIRTILSDGIYLALQLKDGEHIGNAFNSYVTQEADSGKLDSINTNLFSSMVLLNVFSQSVRSKDSEKGYWINFEQLKKLEDETTLRLYLGLIYQNIKIEYPNIKLGDKTVLMYLTDGAKDFDKFKNKVKNIISPIITKGQVIDQKFTQIKKLQQQPDAEPGYQEYYELLDVSLNFLETTKTAYLEISGNKEAGKFDSFLQAVRSLGNIYVDINQKQYVSAVSELAYLYDTIVVSEYKIRDIFYAKSIELTKESNDIDTIKSKIENLEIKTFADLNHSANLYHAIQNISSETSIKAEIKERREANLELIENEKKVKDFLIKFGNFAAVVSKAENSDQVQQAIEAVALPAGSASIKRNAKVNIALNAYAGLFYGNEYLEDSGTGWGDIYGMSAPIGVAASWSIKKIPLVGSFSLFGSLVDLGAVASYRFGDEETETLPEIKLENIFAPGLYGVIGFKNIPISAGYGWQRGPALREVNIEDPNNPGTFTNTTANGYRWSIFLAVDIPLINFYTKSR